MITLIVNQKEVIYDGEPTLAAFAQVYALPETGVAVAVNGDIIRRQDWAGYQLQNGDEIEIVHALAGG
jgi:thiamine biosynthesis protein ThiS